MPKARRKVESSLEYKGFQKRVDGDHRYFVYWSLDGKKTPIFTKTSHSGKDIGNNILSQMAKQCRLSNSQFSDLVDCPMTQEVYERHLEDQGAL